jgi:hypothetical protein
MLERGGVLFVFRVSKTCGGKDNHRHFQKNIDSLGAGPTAACAVSARPVNHRLPDKTQTQQNPQPLNRLTVARYDHLAQAARDVRFRLVRCPEAQTCAKGEANFFVSAL